VFDKNGVRFVKGYVRVHKDKLRGCGTLQGGLYRFNPAKPNLDKAMAGQQSWTHSEKNDETKDEQKHVKWKMEPETDVSGSGPYRLSKEDEEHPSMAISCDEDFSGINPDLLPKEAEEIQTDESDKMSEKSDEKSDERPDLLQKTSEKDQAADLKALIEATEKLLKAVKPSRRIGKKAERRFDPSIEYREETYHERYGHLSEIKRTITSGAIRGRIPDWKKLRKCREKNCIWCIAGKMKQRHYGGQSEPVEYLPGESLHIDNCEMPVLSLGGAKHEFEVEVFGDPCVRLPRVRMGARQAEG